MYWFVHLFYLYFELYIALCCILEMEMSINLMDNILAENYQYISVFLFSYHVDDIQWHIYTA